MWAPTQDSVVLVFSLGALENVDKFYRLMKSKGVEFVNQPTDHPDCGIRSVHLRDPDGNLLEFMADLPLEKCGENLKKDFKKYT